MYGPRDGLGDLVKLLVYFFGAFIGAVIALGVAIWIPIGWWAVAVVVAAAIAARLGFWALMGE